MVSVLVLQETLDDVCSDFQSMHARDARGRRNVNTKSLLMVWTNQNDFSLDQLTNGTSVDQFGRVNTANRPRATAPSHDEVTFGQRIR